MHRTTSKKAQKKKKQSFRRWIRRHCCAAVNSRSGSNSPTFGPAITQKPVRKLSKRRCLSCCVKSYCCCCFCCYAKKDKKKLAKKDIICESNAICVCKKPSPVVRELLEKFCRVEFLDEGFEQDRSYEFVSQSCEKTDKKDYEYVVKAPKYAMHDRDGRSISPTSEDVLVLRQRKTVIERSESPSLELEADDSASKSKLKQDRTILISHENRQIIHQQSVKACTPVLQQSKPSKLQPILEAQEQTSHQAMKDRHSAELVSTESATLTSERAKVSQVEEANEKTRVRDNKTVLQQGKISSVNQAEDSFEILLQESEKSLTVGHIDEADSASNMSKMTALVSKRTGNVSQQIENLEAAEPLDILEVVHAESGHVSLQISHR
ncbi:hypothetical protein Ciccas_005259 [Cichlidogyrus casuarinus]|uniref:Uncharacterized protein n=1 Tax=Cichlidogyrus casuarinus TaxID=1844966 RepID=A0ABD2Q986_9PLAT